MPTKDEAALHYLAEFAEHMSGKIKWTGTRLAGYGSTGPYHCEDCKYLKGRMEGRIYRDQLGRGRCNHPVMMADPQVQHEEPAVKADGTTDNEKPQLALVNIEKGCCEFVNNDIREKEV